MSHVTSAAQEMANAIIYAGMAWDGQIHQPNFTTAPAEYSNASAVTITATSALNATHPKFAAIVQSKHKTKNCQHNPQYCATSIPEVRNA